MRLSGFRVCSRMPVLVPVCVFVCLCVSVCVREPACSNERNCLPEAERARVAVPPLGLHVPCYPFSTHPRRLCEGVFEGGGADTHSTRPPVPTEVKSSETLFLNV